MIMSPKMLRAPFFGGRKLSARGPPDKSLFVSDCFRKVSVESDSYDALTIAFSALRQRPCR
jgi:hypothetical protein